MTSVLLCCLVDCLQPYFYSTTCFIHLGDLVSAAQKGNAEAVRNVLNNAHINPDTKVINSGGERSPLHIACGYGQHNVVAELLKVCS